MDKFSDWLFSEMKARDWTQADLARNSGLTRQSISYYFSGRSKLPDNRALEAIAHALRLPPEVVFEKAGILPARKNDLSPKKRELLARLENADENTVQATIEMLEAALKMQQRQVPNGAMKETKR